MVVQNTQQGRQDWLNISAGGGRYIKEFPQVAFTADVTTGVFVALDVPTIAAKLYCGGFQAKFTFQFYSDLGATELIASNSLEVRANGTLVCGINVITPYFKITVTQANPANNNTYGYYLSFCQIPSNARLWNYFGQIVGLDNVLIGAGATNTMTNVAGYAGEADLTLRLLGPTSTWTLFATPLVGALQILSRNVAAVAGHYAERLFLPPLPLTLQVTNNDAAGHNYDANLMPMQ